MDIDFHHAATYVAARLAGFPEDKAAIVAHAAQYVDDATSSGAVQFDNKAVYERISSAHKMLDARNSKELANQKVWIPFHFLPGNGGLEADKNPDGKFIEKIVCKPSSPIAREMVAQAILEKDRNCALHRLGIAMHVYADSWAHQGFAGVIHEINEVEDPRETGDTDVFRGWFSKFLNDFLDDAIVPLGHGRANVLPDMPFLSWKYKDGLGRKIHRDNKSLFCEAADQLCSAMKRFIAGAPDASVSGIGEKDMNKIQDLFSKLTDKDGEDRHEDWLEAIAEGAFSFGPEKISYSGKGKESWKREALGTNHDMPVHTYKPNFLTSNWKLFHDAAQAHCFYVNHVLLPKYGICAP